MLIWLSTRPIHHHAHPSCTDVFLDAPADLAIARRLELFPWPS
jgi:hypothetical protein